MPLTTTALVIVVIILWVKVIRLERKISGGSDHQVIAARYKKYAAWPVVLWCRFFRHRGQDQWNIPPRCLRCGDDLGPKGG